MSLSALLAKKLKFALPEVTQAERAKRHLDRLQVGTDAILLGTGETFKVTKRVRDEGQIYICGGDRPYRLEQVDICHKSWLADLTNWDELGYQDVALMLNTVAESDDREAFELIRGTYSREVLKASQRWISDDARQVIKDWLK